MRKGWTDTGYFTIVLNCVLEDESLSAKARFLYVLLVRYGRWKKVGNENYLVTWVGRKKLSELTGESAWSVSQRIGELCDKGLIERRRRTCTSSHTYLCDPRSIYVSNTPVPDDDSPEEAEDYPTLELEEEVTSAPEPSKETVQDVPVVLPEPETVSDVVDAGIKEVPVETSSYAVGNKTPPEKAVQMPLDTGLKGLLAKRAAAGGLTNKTKTKINAPDDATAVDSEDAGNARMVWTEFQQMMVKNYSGYSAQLPVMRDLGNCKALLKNHDVEDIIGLFEMVATRWSVIREKWPHLAKTALPTFYATYTLRRELIPLVQSGKGLTSRTHRYDASAADNAPDVGWGDR